jgi:hypothetical protein
MKIPDPINSTSALIDKWHEGQSQGVRAHLGCSLLGHPCDRWLWLSFRWAVVEQFSGRMLRLFRRGQNEEALVVRDLRAIGIDVQGTQARVNFGAHVSGSLDGICESGVPEAPRSRHVLEIKTHSKKSFDALAKDGVQKSKPQHWLQMQTYMHGKGIMRALYVAVCKDDDRLHIERIHYDKEAAQKAIERGKRITLAERIPPPISTDPTWFECRFCPAHAFCHKQEPTRHANCRTCAHSTPKADSTWRCERHEADGIPKEFQVQGCDDHVLHPDLVPWQFEPSDDGHSVTWLVNGQRIPNGTGGYKSREIVANVDALSDPIVQAAKDIWPGAEVISDA